MIAVWGATPAVERFVSRGLLGNDKGFSPCEAMGVADDAGRMVAGVVFHNWDDEAGVIEVSAYSTTRRWLNRGIMADAFGYVFDQLACQMAIAKIDADNDVARRFWRSMGAQEHLIPRLGGRNADKVLSTLTEEQWLAFIKPKGVRHG